MDIYIIRHAEAVPLGTDGNERDEDRPLSETGCKQAVLVGKALKKRGMTLDLLVTSPLVRAMQTADHVRSIHEMGEQQFETRDELAPGGRPKKLARYLNGLSANSVALVGHQPDLSMYVGWLIGEKKRPSTLPREGSPWCERRDRRQRAPAS